MENKKITIIGGGNLGTSIGKGILSIPGFKAANLTICEKRKEQESRLKALGFVTFESDMAESVKEADIIFVVVKPLHFNDVLASIKPVLKKHQIIGSTVTGTSLNEIKAQIGALPTVRIMPNTAIELKESLTCLCFNNTSSEDEKLMVGIFDELGKTIVLPEEQIDAVTVLGSCGIAFALRFLRAMSQGGIEIGFGAELSQLIAAQAIKGAAELILESNNHPEAEIDKVTTPQGITISGLNEMEHQGFSPSVIKGLLASFTKLTNK
ncbi:pyrroline-5-carboxylate reductase [Bacteroidales bacterium]|nr:pyrroline-5-carboxylate reductase [Bacteroidales bacterium]